MPESKEYVGFYKENSIRVDVSLLADTTCQRKYAAGTPIVSPAQDQPREMYILVSGRVDAYKIKQTGSEFAYTIEPGGLFGEYFFFWDDREMLFVSRSESVAFVISEPNFAPIMQRTPQIAYQLLQYAFDRRNRLVTSSDIALGASPSPLNINVHVDHEEIAKARDAFRAKYSAATSETQAEQPAPPETPPAKEEMPQEPLVQPMMTADVMPIGHKGYPGITHPEYQALVYSKSYTCPFCGQAFDDYKIFTSKLVSANETRYDNRKYFRDFQLEWYELLTCPHCLFSAFNDFFLQPKTLDKKKLAEILSAARTSIMMHFEGDRDIDYVFGSHYLALKCAPAIINSRQVIARLWANISWLYEDVGDTAMEQFAAKKAAEANETVFSEISLTPVQEQLVSLTVAGMLFRAGENEAVKRWIFNVKTVRNGKRVYTDLANSLLERLREQEKAEEA